MKLYGSKVQVNKKRLTISIAIFFAVLIIIVGIIVYINDDTLTNAKRVMLEKRMVKYAKEYYTNVVSDYGTDFMQMVGTIDINIEGLRSKGYDLSAFKKYNINTFQSYVTIDANQEAIPKLIVY